MSVITVHRTRKKVSFPVKPGRADRVPIAFCVPAAISFLRKTIVKIAKLIWHAVQAVAEARVQRATIEAELYRNRYKHSSKNDDDLPIAG
jgi:hypothetical protein